MAVSPQKGSLRSPAGAPLSAASMNSSSRPLATRPSLIGPGRRYSARGRRRGGRNDPIKSCICGWTWEGTTEQTGGAGWAGLHEDATRELIRRRACLALMLTKTLNVKAPSLKVSPDTRGSVRVFERYNEHAAVHVQCFCSTMDRGGRHCCCASTSWSCCRVSGSSSSLRERVLGNETPAKLQFGVRSQRADPPPPGAAAATSAASFHFTAER